MATGRIRLRDLRVYIDGYDMSGYSRNIGPLSCVFEEGMDDAVTLPVKQTLLGSANITIGTLNGLFDNTPTSGLHVIMKTPGVARNVMLPQGIQAAPVDYDPVFVGKFQQLGYYGNADQTPVYATIPFGNTTDQAGNMAYAQPWGTLLLAKIAKIAANSAAGLDQLAQTTKGGYMAYQVFAGNGTAAIKVQDASSNVDGSFADLLTSGTIDCSSPRAGIIALAKTATVKQYVRWQLALGTASSVTFALAFVRGYL